MLEVFDFCYFFTVFSIWPCALYTVNNESKPHFTFPRPIKKTSKTSKKLPKIDFKTMEIRFQSGIKTRSQKNRSQNPHNCEQSTKNELQNGAQKQDTYVSCSGSSFGHQKCPVLLPKMDPKTIQNANPLEPESRAAPAAG